MRRKSQPLAVFLFILIMFARTGAKPVAGQEMQVIFAANLYAEDNASSGKFDLFSARFHPQAGSVSDLQQLTHTPERTEFFPSLSPDRNWVAYNDQLGNSNEIRLLNLKTGAVTRLFAGGRFPEWVDSTRLLITYVSRDTQDVFLLNLDLAGSEPVVRSSRQITNRDNCPGTRMASDPFPFARGDQLLFHVLRPNQSGAALATIHSDGTGYRRLTDWNGSGHGIASEDGSLVIAGSSQLGKPVRLQVTADSAWFFTLPLSPLSRDVVQYDSRFASVPVTSFGYPAWGANEHSVFFSLKGKNQSRGLEVSRLLYVTFDGDWKNPEVFDFATQVEALTGTSGRNFSTASARVIPETTLKSGVVYIAIVMHNEDFLSPNYPNYSINREAYLASRRELLRFSKMVRSYGVPFSWQSDWNFLLGVLKWDTGSVIDDTNGKNIVRYMKEDLGVTIDPHSHENLGYNYADVAHLIDSLGVTPTNVVGGYTWDPTHPRYSYWERFRQPLAGKKYPWASWKGDILIGASGGGHDRDTPHSGVWRPKDKYHFWEDDPNGTLYAIGQYKFANTLAQFQELVALYKNGVVAPDQILTANKIVGQHVLDSTFTADFEQNTLKPLLEMQARGEVKLADFNQIIDDWKTLYHARAHLYFPDKNPTAIRPPGTATVPETFLLEQNYPNPFNPETTIRYALPAFIDGMVYVQLQIYNLRGQRVRTLVQAFQPAGEYAVTWDGRDDAGRRVASGMYLYQLKAETALQTRKMILLP